jgi:hypothetical protein
MLLLHSLPEKHTLTNGQMMSRASCVSIPATQRIKASGIAGEQALSSHREDNEQQQQQYGSLEAHAKRAQIPV